MVYAKQAGLANPKCQLYMLFYYIGPALVALQMKCSCSGGVRKKQIEKLCTRCDQNTNENNLNYGSVSPSNSHQTSSQIDSSNYSNQTIKDSDSDRSWPTKPLFVKASLIALFDIFAQSMVYTGNNLAGPTIFAIIYSSVTVWTGKIVLLYDFVCVQCEVSVIRLLHLNLICLYLIAFAKPHILTEVTILSLHLRIP